MRQHRIRDNIDFGLQFASHGLVCVKVSYSTPTRTQIGMNAFFVSILFSKVLWSHFQLREILCTVSSEIDEQYWLNHMIPQNYSSYQPPITYNSEHSENKILFCTIDAHSVTQLSMKSMEFDVDLDVNIVWHDHRLKLHPSANSNIRGFIVPKDVARSIWFPLLRFINCNEGDNRLVAPDVPGPLSIISVTSSKTSDSAVLRVNYRKTFSFSCMFDFGNYPFDIQNCRILLGLAYQNGSTYGANLVLRPWQNIRVPPGFNLASISVVERPLTSSLDKKWHYLHESFEFRFQRIYAQHLMLIFLPSVLIVMLSWVSFWLEADAAAPRVALGLTTILTLSTMFNSAQKDLPPVADIKALDIWMFSCIFLVFASLIEFSIANYSLKKKRTEQERRAAPKPLSIHNYAYRGEQQKAALEVKVQSRKSGKCCKLWAAIKTKPTPSIIDYTARIVFPVVFLIFNICFWSYYV